MSFAYVETVPPGHPSRPTRMKISPACIQNLIELMAIALVLIGSRQPRLARVRK